MRGSPNRSASSWSPESKKWGNRDTSEVERQYRKEVNGIIPGYTGHVPAARDEYGYSTYGNLPAEPKAQSPVGNPNLGGGIIGGVVRGQGVTADVTTGAPEYRKVNPRGILPGYKGFVPGARDKYGGTTFGGGPLSYEEQTWSDRPRVRNTGYFRSDALPPPVKVSSSSWASKPRSDQ
ncbi:hypothetical protein AB1Y20_014570 [Prymnesium parvum]|uniref:Ciliary microtubule inner protein 2A-C-like domain-containing protein n=1 Tax=Prymnesium parvum TaxID=97485 RepID=A0AB34IDA3_PRYPA